MNPISYLDISFDNAKFPVEVFTRFQSGKTAITSKGLGTLMEAITYMYGLIAKFPADEKLPRAIILTQSVTLKLVPIKANETSEDEFIIIQNNFELIGINPRFEYNFFDGFNKIILANKSFSWPKYGNTGIRTIPPQGANLQRRNMTSGVQRNRAGVEQNLQIRSSGMQQNNEGRECCRVRGSEVEGGEMKGMIRFTPEFNVDTKFDNANFYRAQNDNFTEKISQFVNAPSFNKALFILPKLRRDKKALSTTANELQLMVIQIYQTCLQIQNNEISWEEGSEIILAAVENNDKYLVPGARSVFYLNMQNNLLYMQFINRYNLPKSDCSVAFTIDAAIDSTSDSLNDLIFSVSELPVKEDMSDAIYSPIVGIFAYGDI